VILVLNAARIVLIESASSIITRILLSASQVPIRVGVICTMKVSSVGFSIAVR